MKILRIKKGIIVYLIFLLTPFLFITSVYSFGKGIENNAKLFFSWTRADGFTKGYDDIANEVSSDRQLQMQLDVNSRPCLVWEEEVSYPENPYSTDIYFSRWNGYTWTKADGLTPGYDNVSNNQTMSFYPTMAIDKDSRPNIVWCDESGLCFTKWNGTAWTKADGETPGYETIFTSQGGPMNVQLILDKFSRPNISFYAGYYGPYGPYGPYSSAGHLYPSQYYPSPIQGTSFIKWNGSAWTKADGVTAGCDILGISNSQMKLDENSRPCFIGVSDSEGKLLFTRWNGQLWTKANGATPGYDIIISGNQISSSSFRLELDKYSKPNIIFSATSIIPYREDIFFCKWNGSVWTKADGVTPGFDNVSQSREWPIFSSTAEFRLDNNARPNIIWEEGNADTNFYIVKFTRWNGSAWTKADGLTSGSDEITHFGEAKIAQYGTEPKIDLDKDSRPNIVWKDTISGNFNIYFSRFNGTTWTKADGISPGYDDVSKASGDSMSPQFILDKQSMPNVVWFNKIGGGENPEVPEVYNINFSKWSNANRLAGSFRYETAVEVSKTGCDNSDYVVLARGDDFPDSLSGAALAKKFNAPLLLTNSELLTGVTRDEINRLKAKEVILLGSDDALSQQIEIDLEEKCSIPNEKIHRIGGVDRYETAAKIAEWIGKSPNKTCFMATGEDYPDALSASSISAIKQMPILLVKGKNGDIPQVVKDTLTKLGIEKTTMVGQSDVVSSSIEDWLKENKYNPTRLGGDTRYDTCRQIYDYAIANYQITPEVVGFAQGENFPDALASGPLAARFNGLVLLTREFIPSSINDFLNTHKDKIKQFFISGGADVIPDDVGVEIREIIEN